MTRKDFADVPIWDRIPDLDDVKAEPVEWLVDKFLPLGRCTILAGSFGSYKSWLCMDVGVAVASGEPWAGHAVEQPRPVLYLDKENPTGMVGIRRDLMGVEPGVCGRRFKYWHEEIDLDVPMVNSPEMLKWSADNRGLIIFDTLRRFHTAKENSNDEMAPVMEGFKKLARAGSAVVLLHHKGKGPDASWRGAEDIVDAVDQAFTVTRDSDLSNQIEVRGIKTREQVEGVRRYVLLHGRFNPLVDYREES